VAGVKSKKLFARAQKSLVGGVNSPVRAFKSVGGTPVFIKAGSGAHLIDADGKRYVDFVGSWGPLILGHGRREIVKAAQQALALGATFGAATQGEIELAETLKAALPSLELVRLTSSGTEAVMSAIRVARAFTKRDLVIKFAGCYHGHVDSLLVAAGSGALTLGTPDSAGVPAAWAKTTLTLPYNDLDAVRKAFHKFGGKIAAVIVEPIVGNMGVVLPHDGFLEDLRELTKKNKALLIFDEVITGFRLCYGGAQTIMGIKPDITTLGKIIGGGLPMGAYGGRRDIMALVAPLGPVYQAGTLSGNPVAVAAGLETLRVLRKEKPYRRLQQITDYLIEGFTEAIRESGAQVQINSAGSMFTLFFGEGPICDLSAAKKCDTKKYAKFFSRMLEQGFYLPPAQFEAAFVSYSHVKKDLDAAVRAAGRALRGL